MSPVNSGVMGVLNVTPDSFSDGGRFLDPVAAVDAARRLIAEGAEWIDVGGESTRPGARPVDPVEEAARVVPVIEAVAAEAAAAGVGVSVDTRNESTARAAVAAGATLINDVSASLWPVAAEAGVGWVAMHMAGEPATMQQAPRYGDVVGEVRGFLEHRAATAVAAGVPQVWIDPGIGFGKTPGHNLSLLARLDEFAATGFPVLVGASRKSTVGVLTARADAGAPPTADPDPTESTPAPLGDRLDGSLATAAWAMILGARLVRAHDVRPTVRVARVCAAAGSTQIKERN